MRFLLYTPILIFFLTSEVSAQSKISESAIKERISYLADDNMKGRFPGSRESWDCAGFIRENFEKAGIEPLVRNYFQRFTALVKLDTGRNNSFSFGDFHGKLIRDYIPLPFSTHRSKISSDVVFCGYGLFVKSDSLEIDEYKNVDVHGKWVMVLTGVPEKLDTLLKINKLISDYTKVKEAIAHGAVGVVFVTRSSSDNNEAQDDKLMRLRPGSKAIYEVPVIQVKRRVAEIMLAAANVSLSSLESEPSSFELSQPLSVRVDVKPEKERTANVIGIIRGSDPKLKDEYIVLGAHYDHLGLGGYGTGSLKPDTAAIHNGADDNASGAAAIMTIGAELARNRNMLKRSVIIVAFGAEEEGLLGSRYFVNKPPVPLEKIKVMVNLDMVGHLNAEKELYIGGCGTFGQGVALLDSLNAASSLNVYVIPGGVGGSDHVSFYHKDISVLGIHTGGHPEYHTPSDDLETLNIPGEKMVCDFVYAAVQSIANINGEIHFIAQESEE